MDGKTEAADPSVGAHVESSAALWVDMVTIRGTLEGALAKEGGRQEEEEAW